jgi:hypothetical protein
MQPKLTHKRQTAQQFIQLDIGIIVQLNDEKLVTKKKNRNGIYHG